MSRRTLGLFVLLLAVAGAAFVMFCDLAARTVRPPAEVRLGVVTALCGAPLFLVLLMRRLREEQT